MSVNEFSRQLIVLTRCALYRCREESGAVAGGGGAAHILGGPMLFVPFTVPSFTTSAATHQQQQQQQQQQPQATVQVQTAPQVSHPHQSQLQSAVAQTQVVQTQQVVPPPPPQLQLNHLQHVQQPQPGSNQSSIHSSSCSPQQQVTTPNKVGRIEFWSFWGYGLEVIFSCGLPFKNRVIFDLFLLLKYFFTKSANFGGREQSYHTVFEVMYIYVLAGFFHQESILRLCLVG